MNQINICCAECGKVEEEGVSLKRCNGCKIVKYCNANCQRNHWSKHKIICKLRAAELHDEALFKEPPAKEDCPICFLPMPHGRFLACISLPPATILSVPIYDFEIANEELAGKGMQVYYSCCGKSICFGCVYSLGQTGNDDKCQFCNSDRGGKTNAERVEELKKRVEANDPGAIYALGNSYYNGLLGLQQDQTKAMELYARAADLGSSEAHYQLGHLNCNLDDPNNNGGDFKKAKFHYEAAAMAGHEVARNELGVIELKYKRNVERSIKHLTIAASAGNYHAMQALIAFFDKGGVSRDAINSVLTAYNNSCAEMRSEARDAFIFKERDAKVHDEALFKDPPAKADCPICFLPMPHSLICCASLPPATLTSVPVSDFAIANMELAKVVTEEYYSCCRKSICRGCIHTFCKSGNIDKCPFCKAEKIGKTEEERVEGLMQRVEASDAGAMCKLASFYFMGEGGVLQDQEKAKELWTQAAELGYSKANFSVGAFYEAEGDSKKATFYYETGAMAGDEVTRIHLGNMDFGLGKTERAVKHWMIAASAGENYAMDNLLIAFRHGDVRRNDIDATLTAYNNSCAEMRSEARDAVIRTYIKLKMVTI